jgi:hypothetical protein
MHQRFDNFVEKFERNNTEGFIKNPRIYYQDLPNIKKPIFNKSHGPSIEFRWNKTVEKFDVYVLDKKRKAMDIEPQRNSQIVDVLALSTQK